LLRRVAADLSALRDEVASVRGAQAKSATKLSKTVDTLASRVDELCRTRAIDRQLLEDLIDQIPQPSDNGERASGVSQRDEISEPPAAAPEESSASDEGPDSQEQMVLVGVFNQVTGATETDGATLLRLYDDALLRSGDVSSATKMFKGWLEQFAQRVSEGSLPATEGWFERFVHVDLGYGKQARA
jgi:hypothetical protein